MCLQGQDFTTRTNSATSCASLPTWKLWAGVWILEWSAGRQSMRWNPGCRKPARCVVKWVYVTHFPSFSLFRRSTCNSPAEARPTCDDIVDGAPSRPRLSVPTPNGHPMAPISTKIRCHLKWSLRAHYPHESLTPSAFLSQPYIFHHHLHHITAVVIICHLHLCCLCNHHDPLPPLPLSLNMAPSTAVNAVDSAILENAAFFI